MKLLRLTVDGFAVPCILDGEGRARDVSSLVQDFTAETLSAVRVALSGIDLSALPVVPVIDADILPPVARPGTIWCVGLNYSDHAEEAGLPVPTEPILFNKAAGTYCGPNAPLLHSEKCRSSTGKSNWASSSARAR